MTHCSYCGSESPTELKAENDRLRAELAQAEKDHTELTGAYENASVEAERLRAENAELREAAQAFNSALSDYCDGPERDRLRAILDNTAKEGE